MRPATNLFAVIAATAVILAVVVYGGRLILTGTLVAQAEEPQILVSANAAAATPAAEATPFDPATYVADATNGAKIAGKCKACHTFESGGPNRTGPNLWGIVDTPITHAEGFTYSPAMVAYKDAHGTWSEDNLNTYLENPRGVVEGTKMQFAGIKSPADRADLIAYLKTLK
ncbi:MAG: cytochrome c family protein [Pseudomonadaceae bacterium]|nr:cytochrome c family protein [Pseudomonadaceae bacterium]